MARLRPVDLAPAERLDCPGSLVWDVELANLYASCHVVQFLI